MNIPSSIREAVRQLIELREKTVSEHEWSEATTNFRSVLGQTHDYDSLYALLKEDIEDQMPIAEKALLFERLIEIGPKTPEVLRMYAEHLWLHGPESDEQVRCLNAEADALDRLY